MANVFVLQQPHLHFLISIQPSPCLWWNKTAGFIDLLDVAFTNTMLMKALLCIAFVVYWLSGTLGLITFKFAGQTDRISDSNYSGRNINMVYPVAKQSLNVPNSDLGSLMVSKKKGKKGNSGQRSTETAVAERSNTAPKILQCASARPCRFSRAVTEVWAEVVHLRKLNLAPFILFFYFFIDLNLGVLPVLFLATSALVL